MKKLLAILLALVMVMSLAACGSDSKDEDKADKEDKKTESVDTEKGDKDDKDDKNDKEDKDDKNDKEDEDDKDDKDDKQDKDDEDESVPPVQAKSEYTVALDSFVDVMTGDLLSMVDLFPNALWDLAILGLAQELGYTPTDEEAIDMMFDGSLTGDDEFFDSVEYTIVSEDKASQKDIEYMQTALAESYVTDDIEEAYKLDVIWTASAGGETEDEEETLYVVYVDDQWLLMSESYNLYIMDM